MQRHFEPSLAVSILDKSAAGSSIQMQLTPLIMIVSLSFISLIFLLLPVSAAPTCHSNCLTCQGAAENQCESCASNAQLDATPRGKCSCASGAFTTSDAQNCVLCNSVCVTCSGTATNCLSCQANASPDAGGVCQCNVRFYPNPNALSCAPCDVNCLTCSGAGPALCTSCYANTNPILATPGTCTCLATYQATPDAAHCTLLTACDSSCLTCAIPLNPNQCTTCFTNASTVSPGVCICISGTFPSPGVTNCQPCDSTCLSCSEGANALKCTGCYGAAILSGSSPNSCICSGSTFPSPDVTNCQPCDSTCLSCTVPILIASHGNYFNNLLAAQFLYLCKPADGLKSPNACYCR
jgi:proprotein convertase subtilisin/kexin type 5